MNELMDVHAETLAHVRPELSKNDQLEQKQNVTFENGMRSPFFPFKKEKDKAADH